MLKWKRACGRQARYILLSLLTAISFSPFANAQSSSGESQSDFSFFLGEMLPYQIPGIADILPLFGARYGLDYSWGAIEFEGENAHAQGVDWTQASVAFRADIPVSPGIDASASIGPDFLWYTPINDTARHGDWGGHVNGAVLMQVKDSLWIRADLKMMFNDGGSALYIMGGLMFRPSGSSN